jgi:acylaminoacyl-peptidase
VVERLAYRADGEGWLPHGFVHVFVVVADGGAPRQLTSGSFHHRGPLAWTPDGGAILLSANRREDWEYEPRDSELYRVRLADGGLEALTARRGPDQAPVVSPDGGRIAFTGFDDRYQGYQRARLYVMQADGSGTRELLPTLDRSVEGVRWSADGHHLYFQYDDRGDTRLARADLDGGLEQIAAGVGGVSLGRPYSGGSFSLARDGSVAYTLGSAGRPADVAALAGGATRRLTQLNDALLGRRELGEVEELVAESGFDGRPIQAWLVRPPGFDPRKRYPLILEIHGGPFANYGARFAAELQLYAAAGYVVVYANPRGSTSYGEEFANLIHHAYPGNDYDDLMAVVDAAIAKGFVDEQRLYVTGGSGGGVLSAWIVGKTKRFRAAVVQKPVINWTSFVLHADGIGFFTRYWFPAPSWEIPEHYHARSPLSLVGAVETPTMLLTGEDDLRTPISESEQYYAALKLRRVPTAMVRIPGAPHGIASRPAHLIAKVLHVLAWFERWGGAPDATP